MDNIWYLSPSNQEDNVGLGDYGTEKRQMNLLLDEVIAHLERCGVSFCRAHADATLAQKADESNKIGAAWYLALHSNAGGNGQAWGPIAFHDGDGEELAKALVEELLAAGQKTNRASNFGDGSKLYEVNTPKAKTCLLEVDFHDSQTGVDYLMNHRSEAAQAIAKAIVAVDGKQWVEKAVYDGASAWAKSFTERAKAIGLFAGDGSGNYRWQDPLTREEAAVILIRFMELMKA